MIKKVILTICLMLLFSSLSYADVINLTFPCVDGGNISANGSFVPATGALSLTFTYNGCVNGTTTISGTGTSNGTVLFNPSGSMANVNLTINSNLNSTGFTFAMNEVCTITRIGTYESSTELFNGNAVRNCNSTNNFQAHWNLRELVTD